MDCLKRWQTEGRYDATYAMRNTTCYFCWPLSSIAAGFKILEAGGNAVDAGCAAGIALAVLHPHDVKFAGVAPIVLRMNDGRVVTIDGLGIWPREIPADIFMRQYGGEMPKGILRTIVPAAPDAWITALRDFGTMSFGDIASDAVRFAKEGFAVYEHMREFIVDEEADLRKIPANADIFLPGGEIPALGDRFVQADLASTIQFMVDEESAAISRGRLAGLQAAHDAFYKGRNCKAHSRLSPGQWWISDPGGYGRVQVPS